MTKAFDKRLGELADRGICSLMAGGLKGVEKESLRVTSDGRLSRRPHPAALGSALTNRFITTDFSEALLEFVTPAYRSTWEVLRCLCDIHQFTYSHLDDELLWIASMPCLIDADRDVPLARYGKSNVGRMKTIYRRGLGYRYGRPMQTIAGLHYNYSLPEAFWPAYREFAGQRLDEATFRSGSYLGMVRNFRRFGWIVLYLFGASPAACKSFVAGSDHGLEEFDENTLYLPHATSLRMSDLGYSNKTQAGINISLNSLDEYIRDLSRAIDTPEPAYEEIGVKVDGRYRQLSANTLQIENEYYSSVRPKRVARSGERPTSALRRGGIQYVEIRSLDLGVGDPVGISQNIMRFMEAFLIYCLLAESPPLDDTEFDEVVRNHARTARQGRDPAFRLARRGEDVLLTDWGREIAEGVVAVAEQLDASTGGSDYAATARAQLAVVNDAAQSPSARLLNDLRDQRVGFFHYALDRARQNRDYFASLTPIPAERLSIFETEAADSHRRQSEIEAADDTTFDEYLARYYAS